MHLVERGESDGLHPLHPVVAEPREGANAVDRPRDQVARPRALVGHDAYEVGALEHLRLSRLDHHDVAIDPGLEHGIAAPREVDARGDRVERERGLRDPGRLPGLLQVRQRCLHPLHAREVRRRVGRSPREVEHVHGVDQAVGRRRVGGQRPAQKRARLVDAAGIRHVPDVADPEHGALGREALLDEVQIVRIARRARAHERPRLAGDSAPDALPERRPT